MMKKKKKHEASNSYVKRSITISPRSEISDEVISLLLAPGPVYSRHVRHVSGEISQYQGISPSHLPSPSLTNCLDFVRWRWRCGQRLASYYSCIVSIVSITNHQGPVSPLFQCLIRPHFVPEQKSIICRVMWCNTCNILLFYNVLPTQNYIFV